MTHTQTCENATNPKCFCDCGGAYHGRNPKYGVVEMKEGYQHSSENPHNNESEKLKETWNNARFKTRKDTLLATGAIKDRDEAEFASHSSWDELSSETRFKLSAYPHVTNLYLQSMQI